jgi:putative Mg2+ transporter-C (MgtC) family protein
VIGWQEILLRLLAALLFCGAIGAQRFLAGKAAGLRTHILVGVGAALFTIVSGYAFHATASNADRIAAQVVSGIGFIGGGAILKEGGLIKGLTTAAGLWASAALGMAAGAGMYPLGGLGTAVIVVTLVALGRAELYIAHRLRGAWLIELSAPDTVPVDRLRTLLSQHGRPTLLECHFAEGVMHLSLEARLPLNTDVHRLVTDLQDAGVSSISLHAQAGAETESIL